MVSRSRYEIADLPVEVQTHIVSFLPSDSIVEACVNLDLDPTCLIDQVNLTAGLLLGCSTPIWPKIVDRYQHIVQRQQRIDRSSAKLLYRILTEWAAGCGPELTGWYVTDESRDVGISWERVVVKGTHGSETIEAERKMAQLQTTIKDHDLIIIDVNHSITHLSNVYYLEIADRPGTSQPSDITEKIAPDSWFLAQELAELNVKADLPCDYRSCHAKNMPGLPDNETMEIDLLLGESSLSLFDGAVWDPEHGLTPHYRNHDDTPITEPNRSAGLDEPNGRSIDLHPGWILARLLERQQQKREIEATPAYRVWSYFCDICDGWEIYLDETVYNSTDDSTDDFVYSDDEQDPEIETDQEQEPITDDIVTGTISFVDLSCYDILNNEVFSGGMLDRKTMRDLGFRLKSEDDDFLASREFHHQLIEVDRFFRGNLVNYRTFRHWDGKAPACYWTKRPGGDNIPI